MLVQSRSPMITARCAVRKGAFIRYTRGCRVLARDPCGQIVFEGHTDQNGAVRFPAEPEQEYRISAYAPAGLNPAAIHRWARLRRGGDGQLIFVFRQEIFCRPAFRTIHLSDRFYLGLPIWKGEISLWRAHM